MKTKLLIIILAFCGIANAQTPILCWGRGTVTDGGHDEGHDVTTDPQGYVYITGNFNSGYVTFGSFTLNNSTGGDQVYLVKYSTSGNVLWARCSGASGGQGESVTSDALGNIYVTGKFNSSISFGTFTLSGGGVFLVKYDTNGNVLWARKAGAINDGALDVATDAATGDVYIAGSFYSNTITFGTFTLTNAGGSTHYDLFLVKYDASGNVLWATSAGGTELDEAHSLDVDNAGDIIITGYSNASTPLVFGTYSFTGPGYFLTKYNATGGIVWAVYNANNDAGNSLDTDASGNIYVRTYNDLVKFNSSGGITFTLTLPGLGRSLAVDNYGCIYCVAAINSSFTIGTYSFTIPMSAMDPMYITKFDATGAVLCAAMLDSGGDDFIGVATDNFGGAYFSADYQVAPFVVGTDTLPTRGDENIFVAKYTCGQCTNENNAIGEVSMEDGFSIYPNPATSIATIAFAKEQRNTTVKIIDVLGQTIQQLTTNSKQLTVDISGFAKGIYFVKTEDEKKNEKNKKIVIQ